MNCNEKFFYQIKSEQSAYWLGFIATDGCISSSRNTLQIKFGLKDTEHLEKFRSDIESENQVKRYEKYPQFRIDNRVVDSNACIVIPRYTFKERRAEQ